MAPLLLGHRGSPRTHPENTLAGFQAALDAGLDGVELDVRRLGDGTLVVHHDKALQGGRALPELTRAELPDGVPTLDGALAWAADTGACVNVELKYEAARPDDRVGRTLDAVRAHGLARRVILSSFNPLLLRAARGLAPDIGRGLLIHRAYPAALLRAVMALTGGAALHPAHRTVTPELLVLARRHGWRVNAWTVNEVEEVARLVALGVDGLIGDVPDALLTAR
ncbi:glycerophosphodiester phosphodiesterase [Deinococcus petrolearius]|uniref:Glycerophosphodiester phosphodiesterase n=1 Tax=Deinococcus petrolearius TaxID=1751295 RepID=A0ABW1DGE1_9DEIO